MPAKNLTQPVQSPTVTRQKASPMNSNAIQHPLYQYLRVLPSTIFRDTFPMICIALFSVIRRFSNN